MGVINGHIIVQFIVLVKKTIMTPSTRFGQLIQSNQPSIRDDILRYISILPPWLEQALERSIATSAPGPVATSH